MNKIILSLIIGILLIGVASAGFILPVKPPVIKPAPTLTATMKTALATNGITNYKIDTCNLRADGMYICKVYYGVLNPEITPSKMYAGREFILVPAGKIQKSIPAEVDKLMVKIFINRANIIITENARASTTIISNTNVSKEVSL